MDLNDILKKVKVALNMTEDEKKQKEKFEEASVPETNQVVAAEAFEVGQPLFLKTDEGDFIPAPDGEYTLEDGKTLVVGTDAEGNEAMILEVKEGEGEGEGEEMKKEEQKAEYVTKDEFTEANKAILEAITGLTEAIATKKVEQKKEEKKGLSEEEQAKLIEAQEQLKLKKRKKIEQNKEESKGIEDIELNKKFQFPHRNLTMSRAADALKDFDFEATEN